MKFPFYSSLLMAAVVLTGCSHKPAPPTEKEISSTEVHTGNGSVVTIKGYEQLRTDTDAPTDVSLRYITRGDTGKMVALKTLSFVAQALLGSAQATGFDKYQLVGTPITTMPNPTLEYLSKGIENSLRTQQAETKSIAPLQPVEIRPYSWMLVYENLSRGDSYELYYQASIMHTANVKLEDDSRLALISCHPTAVKAPLAQWQANGYEKVTEVTREYMDSCLKDFEAHKTQFLL